MTTRDSGSGPQGDFQILADGDVGVFTGDWSDLDPRIDMRQWPTDTPIVFALEGSVTEDDLWMVDLSDPENPEARPYLTSEPDLERIVVSPDGGLAAYRSNESGTYEIYIR